MTKRLREEAELDLPKTTGGLPDLEELILFTDRGGEAESCSPASGSKAVREGNGRGDLFLLLAEWAAACFCSAKERRLLGGEHGEDICNLNT
jgi:hypothetical protein